MARKVQVRVLVAEANKFLLNSAQSETAGRKAVAVFLEGILHKAGAYDGFRYLTFGEQVNETDLPGIIFATDGSYNHSYPDDSRRHYYGGDK